MMAIVGIERLTYGVNDLEASARFFEDFGLRRETEDDGAIMFLLPEGSRVILRPLGHPALPKQTRISGAGVQEVVWGVDGAEALEKLIDRITPDCGVTRGDDGIARFVPGFGVPMGLR